MSLKQGSYLLWFFCFCFKLFLFNGKFYWFLFFEHYGCIRNRIFKRFKCKLFMLSMVFCLFPFGSTCSVPRRKQNHKVIKADIQKELYLKKTFLIRNVIKKIKKIDCIKNTREYFWRNRLFGATIRRLWWSGLII